MYFVNINRLFSIIAAEQATDEGIGALGINLWNFIFQLVAFLLMLLLLWRFVYRPILKTLDERKLRAAEIVESSDRIKREVAETEARQKQVFEDARRQAQEIIAQAQAVADKKRAAAEGEAKVAAEAIITKARVEIASERDQAIAQLRREFSDLAIAAAGKVIGEELNTRKDLHGKVINDVLSSYSTRN
ncbi:MAG: F0F1 ATP synthase subunit B [Chloroflexi bacterium]|uniref:ATP synthase subunit b n=1 Tax=Candidatus Chlorohelix allophototropha TaxID=3003348 RepID=A0A8T7M857_9CHLR|nr:F0F1 ATP synthase subunit B [Chloroflexota bacterium]WJW68167.1 F0F1 ATP synthase subunit B [Chloroflexota bacterium L227-S17]